MPWLSVQQCRMLMLCPAVPLGGAQAKLFNSREVLFGFKLTDYVRVAELRAEFTPFGELWSSAAVCMCVHAGEPCYRYAAGAIMCICRCMYSTLRHRAAVGRSLRGLVRQQYRHARRGVL